MDINIKIETLPEVTVLSGGDVFLLNKEDSFTGKVTYNTLKESVNGELRDSLTYSGDDITIGLAPGNVFFVKNESISLNKLTADVQELLRSRTTGGGGGSSLVGTLTTISTPVTASGEFLIVALSGSGGSSSYKAIRVWDF